MVGNWASIKTFKYPNAVLIHAQHV